MDREMFPLYETMLVFSLAYLVLVLQASKVDVQLLHATGTFSSPKLACTSQVHISTLEISKVDKLHTNRKPRVCLSA